MNRILVAALAAVISLNPNLLACQDDSDEWLAAAKDKRGALFGIVSMRKGDDSDPYSPGFFVSKDGWAVAPLTAFTAQNRILDFISSEGEPLPKPSIRHVDTAHLIAILKFEHEPQAWFDLPENPMKTGENVAVIDPKRDKPCAIGPLLVKTEIPNLTLRMPNQEAVFSIGSGIAVGGVCVGGLPVIDRSGALRGYYHSERADGAQLFLYASSADHLLPSLKLARGSQKAIPLPLPDELNPFDPCVMDADFLQAKAAMLRRESDTALRHIVKAIEKHPESHLLRQVEFDAQNLAGAEDLAKFLAATKPVGDSNIVLEVHYLRNLANLRKQQGDMEGQAKALREALELTPGSGALNFRYAQVVLELGKTEEALLHCRKAAEVSPDSITFLEGLATLLGRAGKWEEADAISTRAYELEELYRRK